MTSPQSSAVAVDFTHCSRSGNSAATALAPRHVMMMMVVAVIAAVHELAIGRLERIDLPVVGQQGLVPVDRAQPHRIAGGAQFCVDFQGTSGAFGWRTE